MIVYVLDACAVTAFKDEEDGSHVVCSIIESASKADVKIIMNKINLFEVYYDKRRTFGKNHADRLIKAVKQLPIEIISEISDELFEEAGRIKASYKVSLADSIAIAQASISGGTLVTADHHEMDKIEQTEKNINFFWLR